MNVDGRKPWGVAGGVDVEYGLTDAWALRAVVRGVDARRWQANDRPALPEGREHMDAALVGVTYTFDVLRLVPYANLQSASRRSAAPWRAAVTMLASELGLGGDYYVTRQLPPGISFQYLFEPAGSAVRTR